MINIKEYIVNAAILISIIYLSGFLHKKFLMDVKWKIKVSTLILLSIFAGWCSMIFGIHMDNSVIFDLRFVPIIIATIYSRKLVHILLIGLGIGLSRFTFGISEAAAVGFINMLLLSIVGGVLLFISVRWKPKFKIFMAVLILNVLNTLIIAFLGVIPPEKYLAIIVPTALPINIILSTLLVSIVKDLHDEYLHKADLLNKVRKDPLTQLYNRRAFNYYYDQYINETTYVQLAIAFLDIDHFKKINDNYGHIFGDRVLQRVSKLITDHARHDDIIARYGGEEFVIIFPNCNSNDAVATVERIRKVIENEVFQQNEQTVNITLSAGIAYTPNTNPRLLLKAADEALYKAKNNGRNLVVSA
ncbi:GGDEF domain-containing protein [Paenibacillus sp. CMAA1364]